MQTMPLQCTTILYLIEWSCCEGVFEMYIFILYLSTNTIVCALVIQEWRKVWHLLVPSPVLNQCSRAGGALISLTTTQGNCCGNWYITVTRGSLLWLTHTDTDHHIFLFLAFKVLNEYYWKAYKLLVFSLWYQLFSLKVGLWLKYKFNP